MEVIWLIERVINDNILLFQADVETLWLPENATILLASLTNCWCVHNWKQLLDVINQKLVEQPLVPFLKDSDT